MSTMRVPELEVRALDEIKPYWRNPRRVTEEAVSELSESIKKYGYQQPIVVDEEYVIIVGHTRYAALRRMEVERVPVLVAKGMSAEQVKQYRLLDNRAGEFSSWNFDALTAELGELEDQLAQRLFPGLTEPLVADPEPMLPPPPVEELNEVSFICPSCFHSWEMNVTREAIIRGILEVPA